MRVGKTGQNPCGVSRGPAEGPRVAGKDLEGGGSSDEDEAIPGG